MIVLQAQPDFWTTGDFWIFLVLGLGGVLLSAIGAVQAYRAKLEATKAKNEATRAGQSVRVQTITIELSEMCQRLEKLDANIDYLAVRDIHSEVNRKLRRLIAQVDAGIISDERRKVMEGNLNDIKEALAEVRPLGDAPVIPGAVYFAVEGHFTSLIGNISSMIGQLEGSTVK
jgi:hypothetical protein